MLLLAVDTSGAGVAVALHDGRAVLAERFHADARHHAELLTPAISAVLSAADAGRADLTDVAVGVGPGPFTGLRVGIVTARVLALTLGVTVHGVCSLDALALDAAQEPGVRPALDAADGRFVVATDARRREVFWAGYRTSGDGAVVREQGPDVGAAADVPLDGRPAVGRGAALYAAALGEPVPGAPLDVTGGAVARSAVRALDAGTGLLPVEPLYLRRPDAVAPGPRKRVLR